MYLTGNFISNHQKLSVRFGCPTYEDEENNSVIERLSDTQLQSGKTLLKIAIQINRLNFKVHQSELNIFPRSSGIVKILKNVTYGRG